MNIRQQPGISPEVSHDSGAPSRWRNIVEVVKDGGYLKKVGVFALLGAVSGIAFSIDKTESDVFTPEMTVSAAPLGDPVVTEVESDPMQCFAKQDVAVATTTEATIRLGNIWFFSDLTENKLELTLNKDKDPKFPYTTRLCFNGNPLTYTVQPDAVRSADRDTTEEIQQPPVLQVDVPANAFTMLVEPPTTIDTSNISMRGNFVNSALSANEEVLKFLPKPEIINPYKDGVTTSDRFEMRLAAINRQFGGLVAVAACAKDSLSDSGRLLQVTDTAFKEYLVNQYNTMNPDEMPITEADVVTSYNGFDYETLYPGDKEFRKELADLQAKSKEGNTTFTVNVPSTDEIASNYSCNLAPELTKGEVSSTAKKSSEIGVTE